MSDQQSWNASIGSYIHPPTHPYLPTYPTNIVQPCTVGLPAAKGSIVEAEVATYLCSAAFQWASGSSEGAQHREGLPHIATMWLLPGSHSLPLEEAVWQHQVGHWTPESVKQKITRHSGGSVEKK